MTSQRGAFGNREKEEARSRMSFIEGLEWLEAYWQRRPLLRAFGLWLGIALVFLLLTLVPFDLELRGDVYRYAGKAEGAADLWRLESDGGRRVWRESRGEGPQNQWILAEGGEAYHALKEDYQMSYSAGADLDEGGAGGLWSDNQGSNVADSLTPLQLQQMELFGCRSAQRSSRLLRWALLTAVGLPAVYLLVYSDRALDSWRRWRGAKKEADPSAYRRMRLGAWLLVGVLLLLLYIAAV